MQVQVQNPAPPEPHLERLFFCRSVIYKCSLLGLIASFALFLFGFFTSSWIKFYDFKRSRQLGLWDYDCQNENGSCTSLWMTRTLFAMCLIAYVITFCIAIHENVKKVDRHTYHSRKLEIAVLITGVIGIIALSVFHFVLAKHFDSGWSSAVVAISKVGLFVSLILMLCGNGKNVRPPGIVLSNRPQVVVFHAAGQPAPPQSQTYTAPLNPNPVVNAYPVPQYAPHSQPLLPQSYPHPPPEAPPPYSLPPVYPTQSEMSGAVNRDPERQGDWYSKASAPPME
ncbi:hypothetical protein PoB_003690500 [Plakobranchus ocellatus]|uniref:Uncharacterized protein n=1 Tax=Plakobranchus ocellatus TaxID=259542 RepID=A0AAV4ASW4_9GAST|nr:hypothetical protein PoB_003690500 [Plakobranchus ocellatus]